MSGDLLDLEKAKGALRAASKEEKAEAVSLLKEMASWVKAEVEAGRDLDSIEWPKTGGALAGMSVDEALARADAVTASLSEKKRRKAEGEKIALAVATAALRVLGKVALAAVA